jgi:hypothetical protein
MRFLVILFWLFGLGVRTKSWTLEGPEDVRIYSIEKRVKAIELYIKYDRCAADVIRELGYPDRKTLRNRYKAYLEEQETGVTGNLVY